MDLQYGIAVTNKYALFIDEDEDPLEILRQKEEEAKNQKKDDKKSTKSKLSKKTAVAAETKPKQPEQPAAKKDGMYFVHFASFICTIIHCLTLCPPNHGERAPF